MLGLTISYEKSDLITKQFHRLCLLSATLSATLHFQYFFRVCADNLPLMVLLLIDNIPAVYTQASARKLNILSN